MSTTVTSRLHASAGEPRAGRTTPAAVMSVPGPSGLRELRMRTGMFALDRGQNRARMQHLRAEVRQLGGLGKRQLRHQPRRGMTRGSAVSMPSTSVQIWISRRLDSCPNERARVVRPTAAQASSYALRA